MSRRIDIELTSSRDDGSWTWRAAGAREPRGSLDGSLLPAGAKVGDVLRADIEAYLDGLSVVAVLPPRTPRRDPDRIELTGPSDEGPLITTTLARKGRGERGRRRGDRGERGERGNRRGERRPGRERPGPDQERRAAAPAPEPKPKPKRLRPGRAHRSALLEGLPAEQRPIAEQLLQGGIPSVRQAIDKQNEELRKAGKPEVKADALLKVAEDLRPRVLAALWRDRAEAAVATADEIDLRDLRSVVNAANDAGRDEESRALATRLQELLAERVEKEHASWLAELGEALDAGRVVRALRLSSRPPKAGSPIPGDLGNRLVEATAAALTAETTQERWATVLDALAYSPIRRRVIPQSLPPTLSPELRTTVARLGTRLPEIAHIFAVEPDPAAGRERPGRRKGAKGEAAGRQPRGRGSKRPAKDQPGDAGASDAKPRDDDAAADAPGKNEASDADARQANAAPTDEAGTAEPPANGRSADQPAAGQPAEATSEG